MEYLKMQTFRDLTDKIIKLVTTNHNFNFRGDYISRPKFVPILMSRSGSFQSLSDHNFNLEIMGDQQSVGGSNRGKPVYRSPENGMYDKIFVKGNNKTRLSSWAFDSRKRSLVLRPIPLSLEERRHQLAHLLRFQRRIFNGMLYNCFV